MCFIHRMKSDAIAVTFAPHLQSYDFAICTAIFSLAGEIYYKRYAILSFAAVVPQQLLEVLGGRAWEGAVICITCPARRTEYNEKAHLWAPSSRQMDWCERD